MARSSARDAETLALAKARFKQAEAASQKQRERERADLAFYSGEQWAPDQKKAREGYNATDGTPVPARPTSVINKVRSPVNQVVNTDQQSEIDFELVAADDFGELTQQPDDTEVECREGLVRRILRSSEAEDALDWAFSRAAIAGEGFLGVYTRFVPGKSWDKDVYVRRFYNQFSVSLDPAHEQPDGSDAEWGFIGTDLSQGEYEAQHPTNKKGAPNEILGATDEEFRALGDEAPEWFSYRGEGQVKTRMYRVVEYFYVERTIRTLLLLADGSSAWKDELAEGADEQEIVDTREVEQKAITWCKLDGRQILSETDWEGPDLPIVKLLGEELHPYDDERRVEGMVRPARGSQEAYNEMVSGLRERIGLAPLSPWQATAEQIEGYEKQYQLSSTRAIPVLPYNGVNDATGQPLPPPTRTAQGVDVVGFMQAIQLFDEAIQSTTQVPDSRVGRNTDSHLKSGKAIVALQQQSEQGTSGFSKNKRRSVRYLGQVINNLLYPIYGKRPGRLTKIVTGNNTTQPAQIGQSPTGAQPSANGKVYTLTPEANFNVVVKVTRASTTRREEETDTLASLMNANPMFMTWFGDLFFANQDGPGHDEMAKRAKVMLAPPIQQMVAADASGSQVPPEMQQQLQAKNQQIQHAEAAMQQLKQQVDGKQMEIASSEKIAQMNIDSKERIAALDREVKLGVAELGAKVDRLELFMQESQLAGARAHEAGMAAADAAHEAAMSQMEHQQTLEQGQQAQAGQQALSDQGHQQQLEQGQQAADLAPQPEPTGAQ